MYALLISGSFSAASSAAFAGVRAHQIDNFLVEHGNIIPLKCAIQTLNIISAIPEFKHNYDNNIKISVPISALFEVKKNILPNSAIILGAAITGLGHGLLFFESYKDAVGDAHEDGHASVEGCLKGFLIVLASAGALQEFISGGLHLGSAATKNEPLFYNGNIVAELFFNACLTLSTMSNAAVFLLEIGELFPQLHQQSMEHLISVSAAMALSHEGTYLKEPHRWIPVHKERYTYYVLRFLHSGMHALTRYQALNHLLTHLLDMNSDASKVVSAVAAVVAGLERLSLLAPHHLEHKADDETDEKDRPHLYTASSLSEDISYQTVHALIYYMATSARTEKDEIGAMLAINLASGMLTEITNLLLNLYNHKIQLRRPTWWGVMVNAVIAPLLAGLIYDLMCRFVPVDKHTEASFSIFITLLMRHGLKKIFPCQATIPNREMAYQLLPQLPSQANTPTLTEDELDIEMAESKKIPHDSIATTDSNSNSNAESNAEAGRSLALTSENVASVSQAVPGATIVQNKQVVVVTTSAATEQDEKLVPAPISQPDTVSKLPSDSSVIDRAKAFLEAPAWLGSLLSYSLLFSSRTMTSAAPSSSLVTLATTVQSGADSKVQNAPTVIDDAKPVSTIPQRDNFISGFTFQKRVAAEDPATSISHSAKNSKVQTKKSKVDRAKEKLTSLYNPGFFSNALSYFNPYSKADEMKSKYINQYDEEKLNDESSAGLISNAHRGQSASESETEPKPRFKIMTIM